MDISTFNHLRRKKKFGEKKGATRELPRRSRPSTLNCGVLMGSGALVLV